MTKQPDQALFDAVFKAVQELGYDVHMELPPDETSYPFVVMGETQIVPRYTKDHLVGEVSVDVDVWGTIKQRMAVSDMMGQIVAEAGKIELASGYRCSLHHHSHRLIKDNSTLETLFHGLLSLEYHFI